VYFLMYAEAASVNAAILADPERASMISPDVRAQLEQGQGVTAGQVQAARDYQSRWQSEWTALLSYVAAVVLPTVPFFPPPLAEASRYHYTGLTAPVKPGRPARAGAARSRWAPAARQHAGRRPAWWRATAARHRRGTGRRGRIPSMT
jgi:Asp-tRNA(Asn)/Glu-tRNA(Gln) amidotransferase A subunit family amidase